MIKFHDVVAFFLLVSRRQHQIFGAVHDAHAAAPDLLAEHVGAKPGIRLTIDAHEKTLLLAGNAEAGSAAQVSRRVSVALPSEMTYDAVGLGLG